MNKIYRIIWSKTRNCYMVVSEIAKRNGKCSSSLNKKIIASFLSAGMMLSLHNAAFADIPEGTTSGSGAIAIGNEGYGPKTTEINPLMPAYLWNFRDVWTTTTAKGTDTIAIGTATQASGTSAVAIGHQALAYNSYAVATGWRAIAAGSHSVAYGDHAYSLGNMATAIGKDSKAYLVSTTAVGENANATYYELGELEKSSPYERSDHGSAFGSYSAVGYSYGGTALGSWSWVDNSAYGASLGNYGSVQNSMAGTALGSLSLVNNNPGGVALGSQAISERNGNTFSSALSDPYHGTEREAKGGYDLSLANQGYVHPSANVLELIEAYHNDKTPEKKAELMDALTWNSTDGVVSVGTFMDGEGPEFGAFGLNDEDVFVTRQITGVAAGSADTDAVNVAQLKMVTTALETLKPEIDTDNRNVGLIDNQDGKQEIVSPYLEIQGIKDASEARQTMQDYDAKKAELEAAKQALVDEDATADTSEIDSQISALTESYNKAQTTFQNYAKATGDASIALGKASAAEGADTVAIGSHSVAKRAMQNGGAGAGYDVTTGKSYEGKDKESATWVSTLGAVSVGGAAGDTDAEIGSAATATRQITGVAAGTADTDAVNVAQLKLAGTHYYSVPEPVDGEHEANYDNDGATGRYAMAAGVNTTAKGDYSTAVGGDSHINGERNVALGAGSYVGLKSLGYNYGVTGDVANSVAVGSYSNVISDKGTAVGASTNVFGEQNIAVGYSSTAAGETLNTAIGTNSKVGIRRYYYDYSTEQAIMKYVGANNTAVGADSRIGSGYNNVAIGSGSYAGDWSSVNTVQERNESLRNAVLTKYGSEEAVRTEIQNRFEYELNKNLPPDYANWSDNDKYWYTQSRWNELSPQLQNDLDFEAWQTGMLNSDDFSTAVGVNAKAAGAGQTAVGGNSKATGWHATAVGLGSKAEGASAIAIGESANTHDNQEIAVGNYAHTYGQSSIAMGRLAGGNTNYAIAIGDNATVQYLDNEQWKWEQETDDDGNVVLDESGNPKMKLADEQSNHIQRLVADQSIAIGRDSYVDGKDATAVGRNTQARMRNATAYGNNAHANAWNSIAIGNKAIAGMQSAILDEDGGILADTFDSDGYLLTGAAAGNSAVAVGNRARAVSEFTTAIGAGTNAEGWHAVAVGDSNQATGKFSTAIGAGWSINHTEGEDDQDNTEDDITGDGVNTEGKRTYESIGANQAAGDYSTAAGYGNITTGERSNAFGMQNKVSGPDSLGVGSLNTVGTVEPDSSTGLVKASEGDVTGYAVGSNNTITGDKETFAGAYGHLNTVSGDNSYAMGNENQVSGEQSLAIGNGHIVSGD